ncbi:MAG: hypothetical protein DIJKHBIC_00226 [Thermoanaerobaculia bacterium]|nr:hypothetical protein [Thermoanaerobaculia bacterium]
MKHLFGKVAFKVSQTEYLWEDVFLDAEIRGAAQGTVILGGAETSWEDSEH